MSRCTLALLPYWRGRGKIAVRLCNDSREHANRLDEVRRLHHAQDPGPAPTDVLGSTEATGAAGVMGLFGRGGADAKAELWALGERAAILLHLDAAALIPHVLPSRSAKLHIEARTAALWSSYL